MGPNGVPGADEVGVTVCMGLAGTKNDCQKPEFLARRALKGQQALDV